jgi:GNAT superfamily N-acetyltransferase
VCVAEDARHRGIGTILVRHAVARARDLGCRKLTLDCSESLIPFYTQCGLEQMSTLLFTHESQ